MAASSNILADLNTSIRNTTEGFQTLSSSVNMIFGSYQKTLNNIIPSLNAKEQEEFSDAFDKYVEFLMNMQSFVSGLEMVVKYAETIQDLCQAVPVEQLSALIVDVRSIMKKFFNLKSLIQRKVRHEENLASLCYYYVIMLGLATGLVGGAGVAYAHHAMNVSDIGKILKTLDKIQSCLTDIAKEQAKIRGKRDQLGGLSARSHEQEKRIVADQRNELLGILKRTQSAVNEGFELLKRR